MRERLLPLSLGLLLLIVGLGFQVSLQAAPRERDKGVFHLRGDVEKPGIWTVARVEKDLKDQVKEVRYTHRGTGYVSRSISLLDFVRSAAPKTRKGVGNPLLGMVVVVRAGNGYTASFSAGELMPEYGGREVWIVLGRDGKSLPADEGPVRLVVPSEPDRRERWVYGIRSVTVIDGARAAKI